MMQVGMSGMVILPVGERGHRVRPQHDVSSAAWPTRQIFLLACVSTGSAEFPAIRPAPDKAEERKMRSQATIVNAKPVSPMNTAMETWKPIEAAAVHGRRLGTRILIGKYTRKQGGAVSGEKDKQVAVVDETGDTPAARTQARA